MKFIKNNLAVILIILFSIIPVISFGQANTPAPVVKLDNPLSNAGGASTIQEFIVAILNGAIKIGIPIIALAIIYCGFLFVKAQGNPEELGKAKDALMYTLIGAAILLGAVAISNIIFDTVIELGK